MSNMEGKKVPQVTFRTRQGDQWVDVTTSELFDNKNSCCFLITGCVHVQLVHLLTYHVITNLRQCSKNMV